MTRSAIEARSRWTTIALIVVVVLGLAAPAGAVKPERPDKAQKIPWYQVDNRTSDQVRLDQPIPGHVNLNTPNGEVTMIVNGTITLAPNTQYAVWVREFSGYTGDYVKSYTPLHYFALGYFTTDEFGVGSFHFNIGADELTDGTRNIQLALNVGTTATSNGYTVAATEKYALVETG